MTSVLAVHGCGRYGADTSTFEIIWKEALSACVFRAARLPLSPQELTCVSFLDILANPKGRTDDSGISWLRGGDADNPVRHPAPVRLASATVLDAARQVGAYVARPWARDRIRDRIASKLDRETSVVVAHSLGSVAAYDALCSVSDHNVRTFVTLGSPLGLAIFLRCLPSQGNSERHGWPTGVQRWVNISYSTDLVARVKELRPLFGSGIEICDQVIRCRKSAHSLVSYLAERVTGLAIAEGLGGLNGRYLEDLADMG